MQKAHSGKTSDRFSKSMAGIVSYFLGRQEGELGFRVNLHNMLPMVWKMVLAMARKHT